MFHSPRIQFLFQPARALAAAALAQVSGELREVALRSRPGSDPPAACTPRGLSSRVLALARTADGELCGFASARLLPVPGLGEALHLETARAYGPEREGLAARLALAVVRGYCLRFSFPARLWCVFDGTGPCRLGEAIDSERVLSVSCAVDDAARRLTEPTAASPERWASWLAGGFTPVVCFELGGRTLETGFVRLGAFLAAEIRQRFSRRGPWAGAPATV
jgi:hypothetical protein